VLLTGVIWFLIAVVNHMLFPFLFACGAFALALASFACALVALRGIAIERGPIGDAATGHAVSMPLIVTNRLGRPRQPFVVVERCPFAPDDLHRMAIDSLGARERRVVQRRILAMCRGEFELGSVMLRSGDPAGLFVRQRTFWLPKKTLVVPGAEPIPNLQLQHRHAVITTAGSPVSAAGMGQDFYGVREYNPSDGLRHIHWKSSAKFRKLMVQEFERNAVMSVAILLDAHEKYVSGSDHWSNLEYQVRAAASICNQVAGLYCNIAVGAGGMQRFIMPPKLAAEAQQDVLYQLAVLQPGKVALADVVYELGSLLPRNTVIFCLSLATNSRLLDALEILSHQSMTVRWFCARPNVFRTTMPGVTPEPLEEPEPFPGPLQAVNLAPGMRFATALTAEA